MKKYLPLIFVLLFIKFLIHAFGNGHYGFQRDELLHLSVGQHLDWGFMEFPPLIGVLANFSTFLFHDDLWLTRLLPTIAGMAIVVLCCAMAFEMGGKKYAIFLAGVCVLAFLPYYRNHTLFQPVAFEQLFWTLGFYFIIRYINTQRRKFIYLLGLIAAVAILNKYTSLLWILSVSIGLIFYQHAIIYRQRHIYLAGVIALALVIPNVLWQYQHDLPILKHLQALKESQLDGMHPFEFVLDQIQFPLTLLIALTGVYGLVFVEDLKKYRCLAVSVVVLFVLMWIQGAKGYYFFAAYPVMFAAGSVMLERLLNARPAWIYGICGVTFLFAVPFIPLLTPILPIEKFIDYSDPPTVNGRVQLTSDYADMFGWEEQVQLIDSVFHSLTAEEQKLTSIFASNYGEAGAVKVLGKKYGLPDPICVSGTFWLWGPGNPEATTFICIGFEQEIIQGFFGEAKLVRMIRHPYVVEEENDIALYLCRQPRAPVAQMWPSFEKYVFD